jgi:hypothetical protein
VWQLLNDADGRVDGSKEIESFWEKAQALDEADRLNGANTDRDVFYEAIEAEARGVYPADEPPPWVPDPDRLTRRGYENPRNYE